MNGVLQLSNYDVNFRKVVRITETHSVDELFYLLHS